MEFEYTPQVLLERLCADHPAVDRERYHALYLPSFHPESLIMIVVNPDGTGDFTIRSYERSLWRTLQVRALWLRTTPLERQGLGEGFNGPEPPPIPAIWQECAALSAEKLQGIRSTLQGCLESPTPTSRDIGLDGITLLGEAVREDVRRFEVWSPKPGDPRHTYFACIHRAATAAFASNRVRDLLKSLNGYLRLA